MDDRRSSNGPLKFKNFNFLLDLIKNLIEGFWNNLINKNEKMNSLDDWFDFSAIWKGNDYIICFVNNVYGFGKELLTN